MSALSDRCIACIFLRTALTLSRAAARCMYRRRCMRTGPFNATDGLTAASMQHWRAAATPRACPSGLSMNMALQKQCALTAVLLHQVAQQPLLCYPGWQQQHQKPAPSPVLEHRPHRPAHTQRQRLHQQLQGLQLFIPFCMHLNIFLQ